MKTKDIKVDYIIDIINSFCRYIKYHLWIDYKQKDNLKSFYNDILILINNFLLNEELIKRYQYIKKAIDKTIKKLYDLLKCFDLPEDETYKIAYEE